MSFPMKVDGSSLWLDESFFHALAAFRSSLSFAINCVDLSIIGYVWCLVNYKWLYNYISLYEVLKVHWVLSKQLCCELSTKAHPCGVHFLYIINCFRSYYLVDRQPPTFPHSRPCSILGRISLNHRVRDGNGCFPYPYRHRSIKHLMSSFATNLVRKLFAAT